MEEEKEKEKEKEKKVAKPWLFQKGRSGNPKGKPKGSSKVFSLREDLISSLIRIKRKDKKLYQEIIDSYWKDARMRQFLLEIVDGKARQSTEFSGSLMNPIRTVVVEKLEPPALKDDKA